MIPDKITINASKINLGSNGTTVTSAEVPITKRMLKAIKSFELGTGNPRADKKEFQRWMEVRDKSKKLETDR